jgi:hypothetical protein
LPIDNGLTFGDEAPSASAVAKLEIVFESPDADALIVVDRSSSQWDNKPNNTWEPMKAGILDVVQKVQKDIRVGMVTYTGQNGGVCPDLYPAMDAVRFDKNNYARIESDINAVGQPNYKGETPTAATLAASAARAAGRPSPGTR